MSLFSYGVETLDCFVGKAIPTLSIRTDGSVQSYAVTPDLPAGITLNTENGELSGTPSAASVSTEYTITGTVGESSVTTTITIEVDILMCVAMDSFPAAADGAYASSTSACPTGLPGHGQASVPPPDTSVTLTSRSALPRPRWSPTARTTSTWLV